MINPSLQSQHTLSPFCSTNYNKSARIQAADPRRMIRTSTLNRKMAKHEQQRSFKYTRTLDIILEEQQHDSSPERCGDSSNNTAVIATDFWHSTRGMKKSATSVSLDSLVVNEEESRNNEENLSPNTSRNGRFPMVFADDASAQRFG